MINVKSKKCTHPNCKKIPNFNYEGESIGLYCATHKVEGMVDVKSKTCNHPDCKKQPAFNYEGESIGLYCATHKIEGMVDVKSKTCNHPDCKTRPAFNYEGESIGLYCATHKVEGMVDVKSKTCNHPDCKKQPAFNYEKECIGLYCATHKLEGMVDVKHTKCTHPECKIRPTFNYEGESIALYCTTHKLEGMVNVRDKTCKSDWCLTIPTDKYEGYCLRCFIYLFPDKPVVRNYKTKEFAVVEFIKNNFSEFTWIHDKVVADGCSRKRPDLILDLGYQVIIIEVDENQHVNYGSSCETKRMMILSQDVGHRPLIFIRFNPDDYFESEKKITSCWGNNKQGICCVKKTKQKEWQTRLDALKSQIDYWSLPENKTEKTLEVIHLFYDC
jgi:hypothetical protein